MSRITAALRTAIPVAIVASVVFCSLELTASRQACFRILRTFAHPEHMGPQC
jgi:hypothetical protein